MRPGLRQTNESVIHREVAVRMVLAHHFADDASAFARGPIRLQPHLLHGVKNAAVDGLQAVADVGERAADDHRHRVVEIRPLHLLFNVDGLNVQRTGAYRRPAEESGEVLGFDRQPFFCSQLSAFSRQLETDFIFVERL